MHIKRFLGTSSKEAMLQVKAEFGEEAVILSTQRLDNGRVELTAAVEDRKEDSKLVTERLQREMQDIKQMLLALVEQHDNPIFMKPEVARLGKAALLLYRELKHRGMSEEGATTVIQEVVKGIPAHDLGQKESLQEEFRRYFSEHIATTTMDAKGKICMTLLGRTGVGKTTTIAKLATIERISRRRSVALLSLDYYRVGSQEELQRIGNLLDVPAEIAYDKRQVSTLLRRYADVDSLFIDTPGKGWKEPGIRERLFEIMSGCPANEFHLLLSPHYEREVLARDIEEYSALPLRSIIVTKVDEAHRLGGMVDTLFSHPIPLSWITTGQAVPNDIARVNKGMLFDMLMEA